MNTPGVHAFAQVELHDCNIEDSGVVEIPLLLPHWQAEALECVAHERGLTAGEMIRQLLVEYLARHASGSRSLNPLL